MPFGEGKQNPRTQEYINKLADTVHFARDMAMKEAIEKGINPYDVKLETEWFKQEIEVNAPCVPSTSARYYNYWIRRNVFIESIDEEHHITVFQLNRKLADRKVLGITLSKDETKKKVK